MFDLLITKALLKILSFKRKKVFYSIKNKNTNKKALFTFVMLPTIKYELKSFFNILHNRYLQCKLMIEVLNEAGYNVYLYDYLCSKVDTDINYDLFIGHNISFGALASKLNHNCKKVLLTTGCSPEYDNNQLCIRNKDLQIRKKTHCNFYKPIENYQYALNNCNISDQIFMIGSEYIKENGWYTLAKSKSYLYNNVTSLTPRIKENKTGNYIYMSSVGQLRRGLDLVLEAFENRNEKLYICAPYEQEPNFIKYFEDIITKSKNIIMIGYINQGGEKFKKIINNVDFAILPSCSEGQSGSIINLMGYGLIPIVPDNVGIENINKIGLKIEKFTVEEIKRILERAKGLKEEEIEYKRKLIFEDFNKYSPSSFKNRFHGFIKKLDQQ